MTHRLTLLGRRVRRVRGLLVGIVVGRWAFDDVVKALD